MVVAMNYCFEKFHGKLGGFTESSRKLSFNCHEVSRLSTLISAGSEAWSLLLWQLFQKKVKLAKTS